MRVPKGYNYILLPQAGSTNDETFKRAACGEDWVVIAQRQTAGRGRMGRAFSSAEGGLYLSMSWRPRGAVETSPELTPVAGLAVREAIASLCGVLPDMKPPNDLLIRGKKVCGILTEARAGEDFIMVFGIGVNISNPIPPELSDKAGTLLELCGTAPDPIVLAERIVDNLYRALI